MHSKFALLVMVSLAALASGCATPVTPFTVDETRERGQALSQRMTMDQEPLKGELDLYGAMARAIKYNLDYRVESMELAVRVSDLDVRRFDMLPKLVARLDHNGRHNDAGGTSRSLLTGRESLEASSSSERSISSAELTLSWDVLDFGLSYVRAKQAGDEILIAEERKRKVVNRIVEDVRTAYWRAVSADRVLGKMTELERATDSALGAAQEQERSGTTAPLAALTYQRELLTIRREMQALERELGVAKQQLAALINLPVGADYKLTLPTRDLTWNPMGLSSEQMIQQAVANRPELREVAYQIRSLAQEEQAVWLRNLPNLKAFLGINWSSNDYLYNGRWLGWGAQASWNLINVFRMPLDRARVAAQHDLLDQRALALTMAVATQVHVSRARHEQRLRELVTARQGHQVQEKIMRLTQVGFSADRISRQTLVREQMNTLMTEIRLDMAMADLQNAFANVHASMGVDAFDASMSARDDVPTLSDKLRTMWAARQDALAKPAP
jgi:outer membrane protein TolC